MGRPVVRTPSPTITSHLSSPPPTVKPDSVGSQLDDLSIEQLRSMLSQLTLALHEARSSAAHYKLQYELLALESSEASKRMAVELEMTQREVEVLQMAEQRRLNSVLSPESGPLGLGDSPLDMGTSKVLTAKCHNLELENSSLHRRLKHARKLVVHREAEAADINEENDRLKRRIRENREHFNRLRRTSGMYDGTPRLDFESPQHPTPRVSNIRGHASVTSTPRSEDTFAALLLADQVLRQETRLPPTTPTRSQSTKQRIGHTRGTHSLSSLPTTPNIARTGPGNYGNIRDPTRYATSADRVPQSAPQPRFKSPTNLRRRESRDSTISASEPGHAGDSTDEDEVPESQASQAASSMLRRSQDSRRNAAMSGPGKSSGLLQSKLFGQVTKAGINRVEEMAKRKASKSVVDAESPTKRGRHGGGLGLGIIEGLTSPQKR